MIDFYAKSAINRAITEKAGLTLKYIPPWEENQVPRTDGGCCFIPTPVPTWTSAQWDVHFDSNFHEVGHNLGECNDVWSLIKSENIDTSTPRGVCLNVVDDHRNDSFRCALYRGMKQYHEKALPQHIDKLCRSEWPIAGTNPIFDMTKVMFAFDLQARSTWVKSFTDIELGITAKFDADDLSKLELLMEGYFDRYLKLRTAVEELKFVDDVLKEVFDFTEEEASEKPDEPTDGEPNDEGDPGDDDGDSDGDEGDPKEGGKPSDKAIKIDYKDFLESDHGDGETGLPCNLDIDYGDLKERMDYVPHTNESTVIIDYSAGQTCSVVGGRDIEYVSHKQVDNQLERLHVPTIASKLRRYLQVMSQKRTRYNQKRGKLNSGSIHRILGENKFRAEHVFKVTDSKLSLDTCASILIDLSGSMVSDKKAAVAFASAIALTSVCSALNINHEIVGFTECSEGYNGTRKRTNIFNVYKAFNKRISVDKLKDHFIKSSSLMEKNADGDSILMAHGRLMAQKSARKILIVLSDGEPACVGGDIAHFTKQVIKGIEKSHDCDLIGVGILDSSVKIFYTNCEVINCLDELPEALVKILKDLVTNGSEI